MNYHDALSILKKMRIKLNKNTLNHVKLFKNVDSIEKLDNHILISNKISEVSEQIVIINPDGTDKFGIIVDVTNKDL